MDKNAVLAERLLGFLPPFESNEEIFAAFPNGCEIMFRHEGDLTKWYQGIVVGMIPKQSTFNGDQMAYCHLLVDVGWLVTLPWIPKGYHYSTVAVPLVIGNTTEGLHIGVQYTCTNKCEDLVNPSVFVLNGKLRDPKKITALAEKMKTKQ